MNIITLDFETYYSKEYSLSKMTTEEYIRGSQFQVIGVSVKVNGGDTEWASGTHAQYKQYLQSFDWENSALLAHNTMFDGAILSWIFDIHPKAYLDTLSMARAVHGTEVGGSLAKLVQHYKLGEKGTEVVNALGKRRNDFTEEELARYGDYCINDTELTYALFNVMRGDFPKKELKLIDLTLRMFVEPVIELDEQLLTDHLVRVKAMKGDLLVASGVTDVGELMSNNKFADLLRAQGVEPPMKISPKTGKPAYAFAKTDEEFKALLEHPDLVVQGLASARLGMKSTLEETRTERFLAIAVRGLMPVPIRYCAAHTTRWGGDDKINLQNLPSRGPNAKQLKLSMMAPEGYVFIDADSAQIEARVLAWLAGQDDLVRAFANGDDVYRIMAGTIYNKRPEDVTKEERFVGKTTILGCGYGMGAVRFQEQLLSFGVMIDIDECRRIVSVYRLANDQISALWKQAAVVIKALHQGMHTTVGRAGVLEVLPDECGVRLPSGLVIKYPGLTATEGEQGLEYQYKNRFGMTRLFGGKAVENWVQGIARCIIGEQMLRIAQRYRVVLTVHDSIASIARVEEAAEAKAYVEECMRWIPDWAKGLPVNCEAFAAARYGDCYENSPSLVV